MKYLLPQLFSLHFVLCYISVDILWPLMNKNLGSQLILVIMNRYRNYIRAVPTYKITASVVETFFSMTIVYLTVFLRHFERYQAVVFQHCLRGVLHVSGNKNGHRRPPTFFWQTGRRSYSTRRLFLGFLTTSTSIRLSFNRSSVYVCIKWAGSKISIDD